MKSTLAVLALLVIFASATYAVEPDPAAAREITVGTAVPSGQNLKITLDERNIDRAYPEWAGAWTSTLTKEQFRSVVRVVASRKLAAMFPNGFPPDASEMNIEIKFQRGKAREITVTVGC
jgi:lauroyl/myristoyl acyltransferase